MLIAQITDCHIRQAGILAYGRVDTAAGLRACVAAIAEARPRPDVVLATGDLVERGDPAEYRRLRELLSPLGMPVYPIPGNHDSRPHLRAAFADQVAWPDATFLHYVVEDWPVRLIALDTTVPGSHKGELCDARLEWLAARLAEQPERPTVVFMHHPPFATGLEGMDRIALRRPERLATVIRHHPQVERLLCGHVHRAVQARFHGTIASIAPSSAFQLALDLRPGGVFAYTAEPPAFQLHMWRPESGLVSHTVPVGDGFAEPLPFR